jgi:heme/copper-type cytochrome/quinol oxidase subunit 3
MGREATARKLDGPAVGAPDLRRPVPVHAGGGPPAGRRPGISSARLALAMFLGAETMFFTGLIGAYLVLRQASPAWPPAGLPRLPIAVTWANTGILVASCWTMWLAGSAIRKRSPRKLERHLTLTCLLGIVFLGVQGSEWLRLIGHGLRVSSGVYGATFYTLIGVHGLHVLGAVLWLLLVLVHARNNRFSPASAQAVGLAAMYWYYVGGLWLFLFPAVYLA